MDMKKGFTLVELLIVIGILAILTAAVVVVLNPAELLKQARDSQRLADLDAVRSAINLWLATDTTGTLSATTTCMVDYTNDPTGWTCAANSTTGVTGVGWVNINFSGMTGGSPLGALPFDPVNNAVYAYGYKSTATNSAYKIVARLESEKYKNNMTTDGGSTNTCSSYDEATCFYEVFTGQSL